MLIWRKFIIHEAKCISVRTFCVSVAVLKRDMVRQWLCKSEVLFYSQDGGIKFLRNIGTHLPNNTASLPRIPSSFANSGGKSYSWYFHRDSRFLQTRCKSSCSYIRQHGEVHIRKLSSERWESACDSPLPYSWEFFLCFSMQIPAVLLGVQNALRCGMEASAILTWLNCEYDLRRCLMNAPLAIQSFVQLCFFAPSSLSCFLHILSLFFRKEELSKERNITVGNELKM